MRIILVGVAVNAMFTGLSMVFNSMNGGNVQGVAAIVNGNIAMKTWEDVRILFPYCRSYTFSIFNFKVQYPFTGG